MQTESVKADPFFNVEYVEIGSGFSLRETALTEVAAAGRECPGARLEIARVGQSDVLASARVVAAENAGLPGPASKWQGTAVIDSVQVRGDEPALLATLLYACARRARIMNRTNLVLSKRDAASVRAESLLHLLPCSGDQKDRLIQRVDLAAHYACLALEGHGVAPSGKFRSLEVEESAARWLATAQDWGFFHAVHTRKLTRQQYVYALSNIYQFVRHTTRLAARAVAHSSTTEMRSHFINHLNGEINHELIIEKDLAHLGEDVAYVRDHMAPNGPTQEFMAIQESLIGYYADPVLLMASPVAAEGVTGHLDEPFMAALQECIRSWNVASPEKASRFFVSHMHTDGGDDGHWEMTIKFLGKCLVDESKHQFFLRSMRSAMRGTERLYDSFALDIPSFAGAASVGTERDVPRGAQA
jgi:hypothetical protein